MQEPQRQKTQGMFWCIVTMTIIEYHTSSHCYSETRGARFTSLVDTNPRVELLPISNAFDIADVAVRSTEYRQMCSAVRDKHTFVWCYNLYFVFIAFSTRHQCRLWTEKNLTLAFLLPCTCCEHIILCTSICVSLELSDFDCHSSITAI